MGTQTVDAAARSKITVALFVATFLAAIEGTIVGTAMPKITGELQGIQQYSWIISIYLLATVVTTPIYGKLSDLYGRKRMFFIGALIFLAGSMLSGVAQSMNQLIWFRALQGLGAGALATIPYTIIGDLYPFEQRAKMQGWMSSIWGIAGISGPLLGGLLVDYVSWRAIFYMNLPFGIVALYLLGASMKESFVKRRRYIDYPGIATFTLGMLGFLVAMSMLQAGKPGTGASAALLAALFASSVVFLIWFGYIEKRSPEPIIPFQLFRNPMISVSSLLSFFICVINVTIIFYLPLWIQGVYERSATYSGLIMITLSIAWPLGSIVAGNIIPKTGLRSLCVIAGCFLLASSLGFVFVETGASLYWLAFYTFLAGISFGLSLTSLTVAVTSAVGKELRGASVSSNHFIRTLGQTIGITLFGLLLNTGQANQIEPALLAASLHTIFVWVAWLSVIVLLASFALPRMAQDEQLRAEESA